MNIEESDLILWPDPDTATVLPWRPAEGRVMRMYCDITLPDGKPFEGNCRGYLQSVVKRARAMGLTVNVGCECEFYLFETDETAILRIFRWTTAAILTSRRWTRARTCAATSACPSRRWACSPSTATTKAARARTRSASAMPRR